MQQLYSRLILGTVQLGLPYGFYRRQIEKHLEELTDEQAWSVLRAAQGCIDTFETAMVYGKSEERLGAFSGWNVDKPPRIITKLWPETVKSNVVVAEALEQSTQRLGCKPFACGLHTETQYQDARVIRELQEVKTAGLVEKIGIAVYKLEHGIGAAKTGIFDYISVPYNVLDRTFEDGDFQLACCDNGVSVIGRSPFLQGLLGAMPEYLPPWLPEARKPLTEFRDIVTKYGATPWRGAMAFALASPYIQSVLFGVDTADQLKQDVGIDPKVMMPLVDNLRDWKPSPDEVVTFPSLWETRRIGLTED